jgi:hypothetical protein
MVSAGIPYGRNLRFLDWASVVLKKKTPPLVGEVSANFCGYRTPLVHSHNRYRCFFTGGKAEDARS